MTKAYLKEMQFQVKKKIFCHEFPLYIVWITSKISGLPKYMAISFMNTFRPSFTFIQFYCLSLCTMNETLSNFTLRVYQLASSTNYFPQLLCLLVKAPNIPTLFHIFENVAQRVNLPSSCSIRTRVVCQTTEPLP